ncbi:hypothetical protein MJO28_006654 [Puccinia striiformis f. sp. tritici]|uniref:Uncharacterized protein n=1 Tax=Puccinia striiformis f. sp. tritici TaxID=168172 RepID=A0ACC0EHG2_9BASI|nr:hypothetical protein MJO28_006654 [Puccinia striiformis f. sp. tritici]
MAITFKKATQVKYLSGRSRDSRRRKAKKQECRPLKQIARNIEHTNQAQIASHISRHDPARPVRKFKNSFVCYADDARTIVVAVVKFHPFAKMKPAEKKEYERLSTNLIGHTKFQNVNKSNGNTLGGKMFSLGWRKGYEKNNKLGITAIGSKVAKDRAGFMRLYKEIPFVNDFLASRFRDVSLKMYHQLPNSAKRALDRILSGKYDKKVDWTFRDARKVVADSHRYDTKGRLIKKKTNNFTYNKIGKRKKITSMSSTQLVSFNL